MTRVKEIRETTDTSLEVHQIIDKLKKIIYLHIYKGTYLINMQAYKAFQSIFHYY